LREHCLRCLDSGLEDVNASPYDQRRRELVVGRVLGRQFAGDTSIRGELERHAVLRPSAAIVGLILAWKDSPVLAREFAALRAGDNEARRFVSPDVAYLVGAFGSRDDFCSFLSHIVKNTNGSIWDFLPFCVEPLVARIRSEDGLAAHIVERLKRTESGSEKASFPRLLAMANQMTDELRAWCEDAFAKQNDHTALAEFGLDVVASETRPVAHALLDALSPNRV